MISVFTYICAVCLPFAAESAPLSERLVDMSYVFDETTLHFPLLKKFEMMLLLNETHKDGFWLQFEDYSSGTHVGTHMDAPSHLAKGRWNIDEIPLENLIGPAAVIDIIDKAELDNDYEVQIEDLTNWESETGQSLNGTIVMIRSGWGRRWSNQSAFLGTGQKEFDSITGAALHFPTLSPKAAQWLVDERQILGLGTETMSLDRGPSPNFKTHMILLGANIYGLESVANMEELPIYGAKLHVMPMKIGRSSGAPTRIVATIPDVMFRPKFKPVA